MQSGASLHIQQGRAVRSWSGDIPEPKDAGVVGAESGAMAYKQDIHPRQDLVIYRDNSSKVWLELVIWLGILINGKQTQVRVIGDLPCWHAR